MLLRSGQGTEEAASPEAGVPAGLFYSSDAEPGFTRVRCGKGFGYRDIQVRWISDPAQVARMRQLAIPPAYTSVWICASPHGHLQATGRDSRGRKQYRYHERWRQERDSGKFDRLQAFAIALPRLRRQVLRHLDQPVHSRERVLATIVRLLDTTRVRVGNGQYARENGSYGLTTLRSRHVRLEEDGLTLSFRGKSGVRHEVRVKDPRICQVVRRCLHLPGQELFQYHEADGTLRPIGSGNVNDYLHAVCGERFTAKDFRTWHGSVLALESVQKSVGPTFTVKQWLAEVAHSLGNTPAVCRKAYIHPDVLALGLTLAAGKGRDSVAGLAPVAR